MEIDELLPECGPRTRVLADVLLRLSRPIGDIDERERAFAAALDAITLEGIGAAGLGEWSDRCAVYAAKLVLDHRDDEARMMAGAARVLAA